MRRIRVKLSYDILVSDEANIGSRKHIEEQVRAKVAGEALGGLGYGANQFWQLDNESLKVKVSLPWF